MSREYVSCAIKPVVMAYALDANAKGFYMCKISLDTGAAIDLGQLGAGTPIAGLAVGRAHVK